MKKRCLVLRIIYELQDLSNCILWSTRLVKKSLIGQRKENIIFLSSFLQISIWSVFLRMFNPSTLIFLISIPCQLLSLTFHPWLDLLLILLLKNMLLSSACSHNNNPISTTLCNMTRVATRVGEVASSVRLGSACREIFFYFCTSGCIPMASFITTSLTIKITTGVKKNKNIINNKQKIWIKNSLVTN